MYWRSEHLEAISAFSPLLFESPQSPAMCEFVDRWISQSQLKSGLVGRTAAMRALGQRQERAADGGNDNGTHYGTKKVEWSLACFRKQAIGGIAAFAWVIARHKPVEHSTYIGFLTFKVLR